MKTKKHPRHPHRRRDSTPDFWALITIAAFPITMFIAGAIGMGWLWSFVAGFLGVIAALCANAIAEQRLWIFDPKWRVRFEDPDFSFKLAVVSGAILLIIETALIVLFFTDGSLDRSLLDLVFSRQCVDPSVAFEELCQVVTTYLSP